MTTPDVKSNLTATQERRVPFMQMKLTDIWQVWRHVLPVITPLAIALFYLAAHGVFDTVWAKLNLISKSQYDHDRAYNTLILASVSNLFNDDEQRVMLLEFIEGKLNADSVTAIIARKIKEKKQPRRDDVPKPVE